MTNLTTETVNIEATDDIYEPPSSPPPVHAIYFPESYHYAGTSQDDTPKQSIGRTSYSIRRSTYTLAKKSLKLLLRNNNILLIANYLNKVWKQRVFLYRAIDAAVYFIRCHGYKQTLFYVIHFFRFQILKYLIHQKLLSSTAADHSLATATQYGLNNPKKSLFLAVSLLKHSWVLILKMISKTIKSIGGVDSILLAFSTIALTKSFQQSNTIF